MTIDALFTQRALARATQTAVTAHDEVLTYRELDIRANQMAHYLIQLGVGAGDVVGVGLERSAAAIVALLAVLKSGAAYPALDDRQPIERQRLLLTDASVRVLIAEPGRGTGFDDVCRVVCPDRVTLGAMPPTRPTGRGGPLSAAYVAFTSGSTGSPKGVCVPHQGVLRLVVDADYLRIGDDDVVLQYAPISFDASTFEIWGPLLNGARLAVAPPGNLTLADLLDYLHTEEVTIAWLTSGLFHQAVELGLERLGRLRHLLAGGDVLSPSHVDRTLHALPQTKVINGYGPTENTTFTCCYTVEHALGGATVPLGRAIRGTEVHVLDEDLRPVGCGEIGELYAGGLGLAHGYLGRPALTAVSFVADPFAVTPGQRLYRTGDLVRRRADGTIEFVGRRDGQVKIRGFRVETDVVLAALLDQPDVAQAAVVVKGTTPSQRRIVAYITTGSSPSVPAIRERLAQRLPDYAVPSLVRVLDALPLSPNGKVDRAALERMPDTDRPAVHAAYREPETPTEQAMVDLWSDLVGIVGLGADDDFFEIGGHSLMAVTILSEIRTAHGVDVSPLDFYLDPTPAGLARVITAAGPRP